MPASKPFSRQFSRSLIIPEENILLAPFTTLKIGGPARYFVRAGSEEQVEEATAFAKKCGLELFVLGGGSNIVVSDKGFDGLVLQIGEFVAGEEARADGEALGSAKTTLRRADFSHEQLSGTRVQAWAGANWDEFVEYCVANGLAGVECLSGIPGSVGGTPVQNVGAYGQEVSETIESVRGFDRETNAFVTLSNADCGFSYRRSIFNTTHRGRFIVLSVTYRLVPGGMPKIVYKDLKEHFAGRQPSLRETREAVLTIRRSKSMVIDEADPNSKSVGSFFKNPIIDNNKLAEISERHAFQNVPHFPAGEGLVKIPAAWLIENAGFHKGYRLGNAAISSKHSLALINAGGASAADLIRLKDRIQAGVEEKFGIILQPEPIFVGF